MNALRLVEKDEDAPTPLTGIEVLGEIAELIADRLPSIPVGDLDRGELVALGLSLPRAATRPDSRRRIR